MRFSYCQNCGTRGRLIAHEWDKEYKCPKCHTTWVDLCGCALCTAKDMAFQADQDRRAQQAEADGSAEAERRRVRALVRAKLTPISLD